MTNRLKFPVLMLTIIALTLAVLVSCTSVGIASVQVKEGCEYKTEYVIGDELDLTGIELVVTRTDGEVYTVLATDVRTDIKVMNFKTDVAQEALNVVIEYKGTATSILINVRDKAGSVAKYTVSFSTGEGQRVEPIMAGEFESITAPEDPTREGYVFDGWYKQSTLNDKWDFNIDKVVADTTLYAKWSKLYSITFKHDQNYTPGREDVVKYVKAGANLTDIPTVPPIEGMVGSWDRTNFTDIYSNIVVNAQYKVATFRVAFYYMDSDGVTPIELMVFENVPYKTNLAEVYADEIERLNTQEVPKYSEDGTRHFSGKWSQSFTEIVSDLNIEALYEINKYDVTFLRNYEEDTDPDFNPVYEVATGITHNNPVNSPTKGAPERPGYVFDGWYKNAQCTDGYNWNFDTDRVTGNINIYAKWTKLFYVRYWLSEDELYQTVEVREHGNAVRAPLPVKEGHSAEWVIISNEQQDPITNNTLENVMSDLNIYVRFTINTYRVTFYNYNGEKVNEQTVEYGKDATSPEEKPKRLGYKFVSWGQDENEYKNIKMDTDVTARFEADGFKVSVVPNVLGLETTFSIVASYDATIASNRDNATKLELNYDGYHFDGWYTDTAWTKPWNVNTTVFNVNSVVTNTPNRDNQSMEDKTAEVENRFSNNQNVIMTIYAKWSKIHTILLYDENDTPFDQMAIVNGEILLEESLPEIEKKEGKTGAWCERNSEVPFDFTSPIFNDVALSIVYTTNVYTVSFYKGIGDFHHSVQVEHNGRVEGAIPDPVVEGKVFKGWDKSLDQLIVENTDFMALFDPMYYTVLWIYNGITYATTEVEHGTQAIFPAGVDLPVREGYKLTQWTTSDVDLNGNALDVNSVKANMRVYPEWSINIYDVEFRDRDTNDIYLQYDGVTYHELQRKRYGDAIEVDVTVPNPVKEGMDFIGWTIGTLTVSYDNELASWVLTRESGEEGVHSFNTNSVSFILRGNKYYYSYETPTNIANMIASNWDASKIFEIQATEDGWKQVSTDSILSNKNQIAFNGSFFLVATSNVVFYSNHKTSNYEVSYVTNTNVDIEARTYAHGMPSVEPTDVLFKEEIVDEETIEYVFIGWYTEPEFRNKYVFGTQVTSDLTLYARWEAKREYTEGLIYTLNENGTAYTLTGLAEGFDKDSVVVANFYGNPGLPVDSIGAEAFAGNTTIKTIDLPNTLVNIGPGAFMGMTALTTIDIPSGIKIIPDNAFNGDSALETVIFGDYPMVTTIGKNAFAKNSSLKYSVINGEKKAFALPDSLTTIESGAFYNCTALTEIYIPENVISIGDNAFAGANGIRYAVFSRGTPANLGANAFQNYTSLQNAFRVYVPNVTLYTSGAANANWKLLKDKIYDVDNIIRVDGKAEWAYTLSIDSKIILVQYLGELTEVTVPNSVSIPAISANPINVASIGDYAFDGKITSISMDTLVGISARTFDTAESLYNLSITVSTTNAINANHIYDAYSNVASLNTLSISPNTTISELFGGSAPTALTIVKTLAGANNVMNPNFLANCVYVKEVVISGRTENVSSEAFLNCTALEKVVFDNRVYTRDLKTIGANAFNGAISLATFEIWTNSGNSYGIPQSVNSIGANAFDGTKWLRANDSDMIIVGNGILYRYNGSEEIVSIPASVTSITANAFNGNAKIRQVYVTDIENSMLVEIGDNAFANCVNLESVILPASLEKIGASAFESDNKLATVVHFGDGEPQNVGSYAFNNTHSEMKVYLQSSANAWSNAYVSMKVGTLSLFEEVKMNGDTEEKWVWVYGNSSDGNGIMIVKVLGMIGSNVNVVVPEQLNGRDVYEIADYALPRTTQKLDYSTFIKNVGDKPFGGITFLKEITIRNSYNNHRTVASAMMSLFTQNEDVSLLNTMASISIKELIGGILPANVKTVNIIDSANSIADSFLEDNAYVENITLTVYEKEGDELKNATVVALEDTATMDKAHKFVSIGAKAFRNTAWMSNYANEYVIVLNGNLVDYKGANSILDIPETVQSINGNIFENDQFIEVVNIPASVTTIGDFAFFGASKLTKVFISGDKAPSIEAGTFETNVLNERGIEIYVSDTALNDVNSGYSSNAWSGFNLLSDKGIVHIKNQVSTNVYEEYIVNSQTSQLLLSRKYKVTYSGDSVSEIVEYTTVTAPVSITNKSNGLVYDIMVLGNNVFMSAVKNITLDIDQSVGALTFKNLGDLDTVTISNNNSISLGSRRLFGSDIVNVFNAHNALTIAYDGSVTLSELVGQTGGINTLVGVKIVDGVKETVDELLKDWTNISKVTFPQSIEKVGILSLEDTAWYKDYTSQTYGNDFVVVGGSLLYKYKGSTNPIVIPNEVEIINTGAFSNYSGGVWSSSLYVKQIRFESGSKAHTILDYAFSGCAQLGSILLPTSMSNIAPNAFDGTKFNVTNGMLIVSGDNGQEATLVKFTGDENDLVDGVLTIPANVKKIASGAFQDVTVIKKINYTSNSILSIICEDAFNGATALEEVQLPSTVVSIGKNAFYNTLWLGKAINSGADVMIGNVLYQKVLPGSTYTLYDNVISIVEGALAPIVPFTIGGLTYSTMEEVRVTSFEISDGAMLPQAELHYILSQEWMTSVRTNGQVTLSGLIGSSEPLDNITSLSFLPGITSIVAGYAENWTSVNDVYSITASVTEIGENAFRGTAWFNNQNYPGFNYAGESKVIIKYVGEEEDIVIGAHAGEQATGITADAFRDNPFIKSVTFGEYSSISKIPQGAFSGCVNLATVVFNDYVTEFGDDAFAGTAWLANYNNDFVIIDGALIEYKGEGGDIIIPKEVEKIYPYVFRGNETITSVTFHPNCLISAIEANIFRDCVNLAEININENILSVERSALEGTEWLKTASQNNGVLYYENTYYGIKRAVLYVGTASTFTLQNTVTEIMPNAFRGVTTLTQLVINEGKLTNIPDGAFEGCTSLSEVTIPTSVSYVGENAFTGTPWLAKQTAEFVIRNGILIKYNGTATNVIIPENVTMIERGVFEGTSITSIDMSGANIVRILDGTFKGLTTLQSVVFSSATTYVGEGAFEGTAYLNNAPSGLLIVNDVALIAYVGSESDVTIPATVRYVNSDVFQGNGALTNLTLLGEIEIAPYAFVGTALATITGAENMTAIGTGAFDGTPYENSQTNDGFVVVDGYLVEYQGTATEIIIPANVNYIPEGVFSGNKKITSVDFSAVGEASSLIIEANAFRNAINLSNVVFSDRIDSIGARAFYNTAWLNGYNESLIIANGKLLAYVGEGNTVTIPNTVKTFAQNVFKGNTNLTTLQFTSGSEVEIPAEAFKDCTSLLNITFNGSLKIGKDAFLNTEWYKEEAKKTANKGFIVVNGMLIAYAGTATEIEILSKITYIYDYVFRGNENITSLSFASGSGVTSITGEAFVGCSQLLNVRFNANLVELDMGAFEGTPWKASLTSDFIVVGNKLLAYVGMGGDVVIPSGVDGNSILEISPNAFQGNTSITSISFGAGSYLNRIPAYAFAGCVNLEKVILPTSIEYVGVNAFEGTKWLANVKDGNISAEEGSLVGDAFVYDGKMLFYVGEASTFEFQQSAGITRVTKGAFEGSTVTIVVAYFEDPGAVIIDEDAFDSITRIYVADEMVEIYRLYWSDYALKIFAISEM